jgi:predicted acetyltransferase
MSLIVRELTLADEAAFLRGFKEWEGEDLSWYTFEFSFNDNFSDHLERLKKNKEGIELDPRFVASTMLYGFSDGEIIGRVSIRHELNEYLSTVGGHIGYSVAPRFRRNGYATILLDKGLEYCRDVLKLTSVLITCDEDNIGSIRTIEKNGGVFESRYVSNDGTILKRRYWIKL